MKLDFKNIGEKDISLGKVFFLYGNYKKTFHVFCDFVVENLIKKNINVAVHFCTVNECLSTMQQSSDLFGETINCFCIKNIEDLHLEKMSSAFNESDVFILESGNYAKSKKITESFLAAKNVLSIPSFKNDLTLLSLCHMLLKNIKPSDYKKICDVINYTDEDLSSLFKKISILSDGDVTSDNILESCIIDKRSFLSDMEFIAFLRYIQQMFIKEKILNKKLDFIKINTQSKCVFSFLLKAEITQKHLNILPKSYAYQKILIPPPKY